jgi:hypothetical protein
MRIKATKASSCIIPPDCCMPKDPNGVEALDGETDAEYVARQTRLREEAAARMRAKFGGSGGLNGRMGGVGSSGSGGGGGGGGSSELLSSAADGLSSLASSASWLLGSAKDVTVAVAGSVAAKVAERARDTSGSREEDLPRDISDLLGSAAVSDPPPRPAAAPAPSPARAPKPKAAPEDDLFGSLGMGIAPPTSVPKPPPPAPKPPVANGGWDDNSSWDTPAPTSPGVPAPSTHVAISPTSAGRVKKPAAAKVESSKDGWGDFDDKW